ncbi:hypothetical protein [Rhizobium leguminosarum]|uniref:hypothetical protein n=1 Tax=Rhizobium leguminosarum TaxID=384 RepID=UPI0013F162A8|nr:hypothetical protein [Rhizobium leguminosarum]
MPDDLGGKAVALEMLGNGLVESIRSTSPFTISISINSKAMLPKIAEFRKKMSIPHLAGAIQPRPSGFSKVFNARMSLWLQKE